MSKEVNITKPIFIIGIMQRSGTNYLHDLLNLHPDCDTVVKDGIWEDYFLYNIDYIRNFTQNVTKNWEPNKKNLYINHLSDIIGYSILRFLKTHTKKKRIITKTPGVKNIEDYFNYFQDSYLIIIVRDGRSVSESIVKGFKWRYETAFRYWAESANEIFRFIKNNSKMKDRYIIVKYEEIFDNREEIKRVLEFLNLNIDSYDFDRAINLPLKGSSFVKGERSRVNWEEVVKPKNFNPIDRWKNWDESLHKRFNYIAGKFLLDFGYLPVECHSKYYDYYMNKLLDINWYIRQKVKPLYQKLQAF